LSNAIAIGNLIASIIPGLFFGSEAKGPMKPKFTIYLIIISTMVTAFSLPLVFLAKNKPPSPPSVIASKKEEPFDFR